MSTLVPYITIAETVIGALAATISLADALMRRRTGRRR